jgi:hypothetical protein
MRILDQPADIHKITQKKQELTFKKLMCRRIQFVKVARRNELSANSKEVLMEAIASML